jgi:putative peptidoglycan lipid II flippase
MQSFLKRTQNIVFSQQKSIVASAVIISSMLMLARIFGLARFRVMNSFFTKEELALYLAAFRIPDFVFEILVSGALSSTFIPFFLSYDNDKKKQSEIASTLVTLLTILLALSIVVLYVWMPQITQLTVIGFDENQLNQVVSLSRLILIGQLPFLFFSNILTGFAQAHKRFMLPALAPALYNMTIVFSTALLAPHIHLNAIILGVVFGACMAFAIQLPILSHVQLHLAPTLQALTQVKDFFKQVVPRICTVLATQIEATIDQTLTTLISTGAYTIFYYGQHLQLLPISIIGIAFGQASLPYLTDMYQKRQYAQLNQVIRDSITNVFFVMMPVMLFFIVSRTPIVRLVYGGHRFDWVGTVQTAETMSLFALSMPFHSCYYFITRCFYSINDNKTPFLVGILYIGLNALLSYIAIAMLHLPVYILGLTFSIVIILQVVTLFMLLTRALKLHGISEISKELAKLCISTLFAFALMYPAHRLLDELIFDTTRTINLISLMMTTGSIMMIGYLLSCWLLDVKSLSLLASIVKKIGIFDKKPTSELLSTT